LSDDGAFSVWTVIVKGGAAAVGLDHLLPEK